MSGDVTGISAQANLRVRAVERLKGAAGSSAARQSAPEALGVLFEMASAPATAGSALAVLHELQVHQVELELQDEELRRSCAELEETLRRQTQLYDHAPVAYFTVDRTGTLRELNLLGAAMLGGRREQLLGQPLFGYFAPRSTAELQDLLARLSDDAHRESGALQLLVGDGAPRSVRACVKLDPADGCFLLALVNAAEPRDTRAD